MDTKWTGVGLAVVAAAAIAYGVTLRSWWKFDLPDGAGRVTAGLRDVEVCQTVEGAEARCKTATYEDVVTASKTKKHWLSLGSGLHSLGLVSAGLLVLTSLLALLNVAISGLLNPGRITAIVCGLLAVGACAFVFMPPGRGLSGLDRAGPVVLGGALAGAAGAIRLFQWGREHLMRGIQHVAPTPTMMAATPQQQVRTRATQAQRAISLSPGEVPTPVAMRSCEGCGQPAEVAASGWYCRRCQRTVA